MGNETSAYNDCEFEQEIHLPGQEHWMIHQASRAKDGSQVSVFVYSKNDQKYDLFVENYVKSLKTLKHPGILKFLAFIKNSDEKWVITERVVPLETVIDKLSPTEVCAGLYSVVEALAFLHDRGSICHNNICQTSVFVAQDGSWKLGGLEYACRFHEADATFLSGCKNMRFQGAFAPEEKAGKVETKLDFGHSRDAFAFGVFAEYLLEYLSPLGAKCSDFELRIRDDFMNPDPKLRPKMNTLLQNNIFKDDYVSILNFLKNITIKTEIDKKLFFSTVAEKLYLLPEETVATRLVHPFLSRFVLLDQTACDQALPHLLTPCTERKPTFEPDEINPLLPEPLFRRHVLPEIYKIFHVRDAHIRMVLLRHFPDYVHLFSKSILSSIFPQLLLGLRDNNDALVSMTLHAVADLVPILGGDIVIGAKRNKIFAEGKPKFDRKVADNSSQVPQRQNGPLTVKVPSQQTPADAAKKAEKERKREEAKRRSEERRKKREERLKNQTKVSMVTDPDTNQADNTAKEEDGYPADIMDQPSDRPQGNDQSERSKSESGSGDNEEDFSDMDKDDGSEFSAMDTTEDKSKMSNSSPQELGPPVQVDWSDVNQDAASRQKTLKLGKGTLKLQKEKTDSKTTGSKVLTSPPPKSTSSNPELISGASEEEAWEEDSWNVEDNWETKSPRRKNSDKSAGKSDWNESKWEDLDAVGTKSPKSPKVDSPGKQSSKTKSTNVKRDIAKPKVQDIDLFSMDIKTSKSAVESAEDFDFFKDMKPELKPQGDSLLSILKGDIKEVKAAHGSKVKGQELDMKSAISFAVKDTAEMDAGGWGDDEDWGIEDDATVS